MLDFTTVCEEGEVRLVTQSRENEGLVQICIFNEWLTLCDNGFDDSDAQVVCFVLGFEFSNAGNPLTCINL